MKGNSSVIPGYDLTSQPATITMITSSDCMQILSTDTFLFLLVERNEMDHRFGIKKTSICVVRARGAYIMGRIGIFGARPIMPQAPLAK